jgi:hypothetical protein
MGPKISEARRGSVSFRSVTTVGGMKSLEASGGLERTSFPLAKARSWGETSKVPGIDNSCHSGGRIGAVGFFDGLDGGVSLQLKSTEGRRRHI